jgi:hypothetical protein
MKASVNLDEGLITIGPYVSPSIKRRKMTPLVFLSFVTSRPLNNFNASGPLVIFTACVL